MAGAGYKLFATGDVLSASDVNTYIMQQTVMVFASSAARTTALSSVLAEGMISYLKDTNVLEVYDGSAWVGATGDITGLTAGTGVSISSATGPVPTVGIDTAVVPQLGAANTFTGGVQQITTASAATKGLIVKATLSQTANLTEWQDSTAAVKASIASNGDLTNNAIFTVYGRFGGATFTDGAALRVNSYGTSVVTSVIKAIASQTANLTEWQNSSGGVLGGLDPSGNFYIAGKLRVYNDFSSMISAQSSGASVVGAVIRGAASQTADLQQWQNSAGTVLAKVASDGTISTPTLALTSYIVDQSGARPYIDFTVANRMIAQARNAAYIPWTVRGAASQTANLTEWQDSSGNILARVTSAGAIVSASSVAAASFNTSSTGFQAGVYNGGGYIRIEKATASVTTGSTTAAQLFLLTGTNANTVKLVIRSNGAETTILDNIPTT